MAKIHEELVAIKLSKLVRDNESPEQIITEEITATLETVVQEMVNSGSVVVEVIKG